MNTISYDQATDALMVQFQPFTGKPNKDLGDFQLWWDEKGGYCAIKIAHWSTVWEDLHSKTRVVKLGGLWRGIRISEEDIKSSREELLRQLEAKF